MAKFINNLILTSLIFSMTANAANTNESLAKIEKTKNEAATFIDNLNTKLPQIVQDINSSKSNLSKVVLQTIRGTYKEITLMELIKAMLPLKKNNLDDRLLPLAGYLAIESIILKEVSQLKRQKTSDKNSKINKKIKDSVKELKEKAAILRATLNNCLIQFLHLPDSLNNVDTKKAKISHDVKEILEELNYKKLPEILGVKSKKLKEEFYESAQKATSCLLTPADQTTLKAFVKGPMFQKMKASTSKTTFSDFSENMLSNLPASAQDIINQAKTTILAS